MTDDATGTQSVKIPKAPVVEGLPLPPSIEVTILLPRHIVIVLDPLGTNASYYYFRM